MSGRLFALKLSFVTLHFAFSLKELFTVPLPVLTLLTFKTISSDSADSISQNEDCVLETDSIDLDVRTAYGLPFIIDFGSHLEAPAQ